MSFNGEMGAPGLECAPLSTRGFRVVLKSSKNPVEQLTTATKFMDFYAGAMFKTLQLIHNL